MENTGLCPRKDGATVRSQCLGIPITYELLENLVHVMPACHGRLTGPGHLPCSLRSKARTCKIQHMHFDQPLGKVKMKSQDQVP